MKIQCPDCGSVYQIDDSKIPELPPTGAIANCKKCNKRFRFGEQTAPVKKQGPNGEKFDDHETIIVCPNCGHVNLSTETCENCGAAFTEDVGSIDI